MAQIRINKVLRELNISLDRAVDFLESKGIEIEKSPNTKISQEVYDTLSDEFQTDATKREKAQEVSEAKLKEKEKLREEREREIEEKQKQDETVIETVVKAKVDLSGPKKVGKIDLDKPTEKKDEEKPKVKAEPVAEKPKTKAKAEQSKETDEVVEKKPAKKEVAEKTLEEPLEEKLKTKYKKLSGPTSTGKKIDLSQFNKPKKKKEDKKPESKESSSKRKRRRISKGGADSGRPNYDNRKGQKGRGAPRPKAVKEEPSEEEVQKQIRETLEKLQGKSNKGKGAK